VKSLLYVHKKVAKGKTYYYFDLGKDERGNRILKRLPDIRSREFANAYKAAQGQRTKQGAPESAKNFDWLVRLYEKSPEFRSLATTPSAFTRATWPMPASRGASRFR
jgi:hypothetical protein